MLALAEPPTTQPNPTPEPGLRYPPDWHREEEARERAYLDARVRWYLKRQLPLLEEGPR